MVKVYLSRNNIEYSEHNVSQDRDSLKELVSMGFRSTPVTVIGDENVLGYSPAKLEQALKNSGYIE